MALALQLVTSSVLLSSRDTVCFSADSDAVSACFACRSLVSASSWRAPEITPRESERVYRVGGDRFDGLIPQT